MISVHWETNTKKKIPTGEWWAKKKITIKIKKMEEIVLYFFNKFSQFFSNLKKILGCRIWSFWLNVCFSSWKQPPIKQVSFSISRYFAFATRSIWDEMKKRSLGGNLSRCREWSIQRRTRISRFFRKTQNFCKLESELLEKDGKRLHGNKCWNFWY